MAYRNTIFNQLLKLVPRLEFESLAKSSHCGRALRKTSRWSQFVSMTFGHLSGRTSLRDIESNLLAQESALYHLGAKPVARSTLARLNKNQPSALFQKLFEKLYKQCLHHAPRHGFRFKNKLYSLDASLIDLSLKIFPWSHYALGKGAVKLQLGLDHDGLIPAFACITDCKMSDNAYARTLTLQKGSIVVFDRGYSAYEWFKTLTNQGVYFVTRMRSNARYHIVERSSVDKSQGVTSDQIIRYSNVYARKKQIPDVRRIGYRDSETGKHYIFITNHLELSAKTIAEIYKQRWQVELFFRWIKQHLKIKSFLGTTKNAVMTQIWIALCVHLLIAYLKFIGRFSSSMLAMLQLLQLNLFSTCTLAELLCPEPIPPPEDCPRQVLLSW